MKHIKHLARIAAKSVRLQDRIWVQQDGSELVLRATDLEVWVELRLEAHGTPFGPADIDAKALLRALAAAGEAPVMGPAGDGQVEVSGDVTTRLAGASPDNWPDPPEAPVATEADLEALREAVRFVSHAVGNDATRPILQAIHFAAGQDGVRVEATDGVRAAWATAPELPVDRDMLLRGDALAAALESSRAGMAVLPGWVYVESHEEDHSLRWWIRRLDGQYPDIQSVVPKSWTVTIRSYAGTLADRMRALAKAGDGFTVMRLDAAGTSLVAQATDHGMEAQTSIGVVEVTDERDDAQAELRWAWNARFAADAFGVFGTGHVDIHVADPLSPIVITAPQGRFKGHACLIMPVRMD
ncbi:MAG TPA: hypothetical protein ENK62_09365 [Chromatiales bacterium]|nr:hypothetical protein [Chromatiales bacterium]